MDFEHLQQWVGRTEVTTDVAVAAPLQRLAALLDHETPPWPPGEAPPLAHWLNFLPSTPQSQLGTDGHPRRGGFLPPIPLPRRMWAGGQLQFEVPIPVGARLERLSTIDNIVAKQGRSGSMVFVTVRHEIKADGHIAVREQQDIVYRELQGPASGVGGTRGSSPDVPPSSDSSARPSAEPERIPTAVTERTCDAVQLFRFSALTFNAHRIHYDRDYCRNVEGYRDLIVHGPFTAMLLMDHYLRQSPEARVVGFSFRAQQPLYVDEPFQLCLTQTATGADLWTRDSRGAITMSASVQVASAA